MSYPARVFRIAIASPADVEEERAAAVKAIQDWNDLHSADRKTVLLPLRWETHTAPALGERPQENINREVVDRADLLIGIFWTRIGSPTGEFTSGTIEEIDRAGRSGKPVMLYFSQIKVDPSTLDLEQLSALQKFRSATYPQGLVEHYSSLVEFREKLARQLEMQVRKLMLANAETQSFDEEFATTRPILTVQFADADSGEPRGDKVAVALQRIQYDAKRIPDYEQKKQAHSAAYTFIDTPNVDYYREVAHREAFRRSVFPFRIAIQNTGSVGARDVVVEISQADGPDGSKLLSSSDVPSTSTGSGVIIVNQLWGKRERRGFDEHREIEFGALQPGRTLVSEDPLYVTAGESGVLRLVLLIYADRLPAPVKQELTVDIRVEEVTCNPDELVPELSKKRGNT